MNFRGREAVASMTSEVKTESRFGLSGPNYHLGPVLDAEIGLIILFRPSNYKVIKFKKWFQILENAL